MSILTPYALLSQGFYSGLINAIGNITYGTGKLIAKKEISSVDPISRLDLEHKVSILRSLLQSQNTEDPLLKRCLASIEEIMEEIDGTLAIVEKKQLEYMNRWFRKFRNSSLEREMERLEYYSKILEDRLRYTVNTLFLLQLMNRD